MIYYKPMPIILLFLASTYTYWLRKQQAANIAACFLGSWLSLIAPPTHAATATPVVIDQQMRTYLLEAIGDSDSFKDKFDAEVWLVDMSGRLKPIIKDDQQRIELLKLIHSEASRAGLPPDMVLALIHTESYFQQYAISSVGAQGLMQVMPFWKKELGRSQDNLTDVQTNLRYGCTILRYYLDKENGRWYRALARYNGSLGKTWYPERVFNKWKKHWYTGPIKIIDKEVPLPRFAQKKESESK